MSLRVMVAVGILATGDSGAAMANAFDDCVLENMRGTTSDLAPDIDLKKQNFKWGVAAAKGVPAK